MPLWRATSPWKCEETWFLCRWKHGAKCKGRSAGLGDPTCHPWGTGEDPSNSVIVIRLGSETPEMLALKDQLARTSFKRATRVPQGLRCWADETTPSHNPSFVKQTPCRVSNPSNPGERVPYLAPRRIPGRSQGAGRCKSQESTTCSCPPRGSWREEPAPPNCPGHFRSPRLEMFARHVQVHELPCCSEGRRKEVVSLQMQSFSKGCRSRARPGWVFLTSARWKQNSSNGRCMTLRKGAEEVENK